jgi:hypothetical protein
MLRKSTNCLKKPENVSLVMQKTGNQRQRHLSDVVAYWHFEYRFATALPQFVEC